MSLCPKASLAAGKMYTVINGAVDGNAGDVTLVINGAATPTSVTYGRALQAAKASKPALKAPKVSALETIPS